MKFHKVEGMIQHVGIEDNEFSLRSEAYLQHYQSTIMELVC